MALKDQVIRNVRTGQSIRFIRPASDTGGGLLEMESTFSPDSKRPPDHYHPNQAEDFTIIAGALTVHIDGREKVFNAGDRLYIPPNSIHSMWNESGSETVVNWLVRPALNTEFLLEKAFELDNSCDLAQNALDPLMQKIRLAAKFTKEFRLARPPFFIQNLLFRII